MNPYKLCAVKQVGDGKDEGVIRFTLTEKKVDRDSEVVLPDGVKLDNFKKNPVVLWAHQSGGWSGEAIPPIGKVLARTIDQTEDHLEADVEFDLNDPFAKMIYNKYLNGFLNAGSIGFRAIAFDKEPVLPGQKGYTITKSELYEFSAVPVPALPTALAKSFTPDELENDKVAKFADFVKDFAKNDNFDNTPEGWIDFINKTDNKADHWVVDDIENTATATELPEDQQDMISMATAIVEQDKTDTHEKVKDYIEDSLIQLLNHGAIPFREYEKAAEETSFEYRSAVERIRAWASSDDTGNEETIDWNKFRRAFAWFDPRKPRNVDSYKLLHHDVIDSELKSVWRGAADSMIRLLGAKGSVDIPDNDKMAVYNHLCRHYNEFEKNIPDFKIYQDQEIESLNTEEITEDDINEIVTNVLKIINEQK